MRGVGGKLVQGESKKRILDDTIRAIVDSIHPGTRAKIKLPNVIGIGSGRCGTSYLFGLLREHDDFYVSPLKEVNYFGIKQAPFTRHGWSLDDYRLCFASQNSEKHIVEISPVYISYATCVQQIVMTLRPVRILVTIRNPLARFISHYSFHKSKHGYNDINRYAEDALREYVPGYFNFRWNSPVKALQLSLYTAGIKAALDALGKANVLVLLYEDLIESDATWKTQLGSFFGTDFSNIQVAETLKNPSTPSGKSELDQEIKSRLIRIFAEDTARLSDLIGQDLAHRWR